MGYYSAGGYYEAGGFSFKKLGRFIGKAVHNPILSGVIGLIPGGSTALAGVGLVDSMSSHKTAPAAIEASQPGTPGHNAAVAAGNVSTRRRRTRRRRRWSS